jgi:hypothetical protein
MYIYQPLKLALRVTVGSTVHDPLISLINEFREQTVYSINLVSYIGSCISYPECHALAELA